MDKNELTDEELLQQAKKIKSTNIMNAALIGFVVGIGFYAAVKNGFGVFTIILLFFLILAIRRTKKNKDLEKELKQLMKDRNLN